MKEVISVITLLLVFLLSVQAEAQECSTSRRFQQTRDDLGSSCQHQENRFNCLDVEKITDGDTIAITIPGVHPYFGKNTFVRLFGLDTPESRPPSVKCIAPTREDADIDHEEYQTCLEAERLRECEINASKEATEALHKEVCEDADRVDVELSLDDSGNLFREKYGRVLGNVIVTRYSRTGRATTKNVRDFLISERLAFEYDGGTKESRDWCNKRLITNPKLKSDYVKANFCNSRKCTEKTLQVRCFHRNGFDSQVECYQERIDDNIGRWFSSCNRKTGSERRDCYSDKSADYYKFCRLFSSSDSTRKCRVELAETMENYCNTIPNKTAGRDCKSML